jgi:pyruvate dehydrogenase E1 component beta subunit
MFAHIPGMSVAMPATPYDAKGIFLAAITGRDPVLIIEHRRLYDAEGAVPKDRFQVKPGEGAVLRKGKDVTIVAYSLMAPEALAAAQILKTRRIDAEIIDLRWIKPLDKNLILRSVKKTGRLVALDTSWRTCSVASEIAAIAAEEAFASLKAPVARVTLPELPSPTTVALERTFYPGADEIVAAVERIMGRKSKKTTKTEEKKEAFIGPF